MSRTKYELEIENRSLFRYYLGLVARLKRYLYYSYVRYIARKKGAIIGKNVVLPLSLAKRSNKNLIIGDNTSIQTDLIDIRTKVCIGSNVIIGAGVEILTCSHNIDSLDWEFKAYGIVIEDYVWIATKTFILPSCRKILFGSVCAAGSVVVKDVDEKMIVVGGNPAAYLRKRKQIHSDLVVSSLRGADLEFYSKTRKKLK